MKHTALTYTYIFGLNYLELPDQVTIQGHSFHYI